MNADVIAKFEEIIGKNMNVFEDQNGKEYTFEIWDFLIWFFCTLP